jgi:hypothetical protein
MTGALDDLNLFFAGDLNKSLQSPTDRIEYILIVRMGHERLKKKQALTCLLLY